VEINERFFIKKNSKKKTKKNKLRKLKPRRKDEGEELKMKMKERKVGSKR
jgi:hypothetical protein